MTHKTHIGPFIRLVERQHGRITAAQLTRLGIARSTIRVWEHNGYLVRLLPGTYAVGHATRTREADLWTAILHAGPGAMLSHATAAHRYDLIDYAPRLIEVSTARQINSTKGIRVYSRRQVERHQYEHFPVTSIPQTLLDLAATNNLRIVRRALAKLDFAHRLDLRALEAICSHGRLGSTRLKQALQIHQPELAHTNGSFEERFLEWCEHWRVPVPHFNVELLPGITPDAYWPSANLVVELDGYDNHASRAQLRRDKRNDLTLRTHGFTVRRYDWVLLESEPREIRDEILKELRRAPAPLRPAPNAPPLPRRRPGRAAQKRQSG